MSAPYLLDRHLTATCDLAARDESATNGDGQPVVAYPTVAHDVPCRLRTKAEDEQIGGVAPGSVAYSHALTFAASAAVPERGRVTALKRGGALYDPGPFEIVAVLDRQGDAVVFKTALVQRLGVRP